MKIEDSFRVARPIEQVWAAITDPARVGPCIPGCRGVEVTGPASYKAAVQVAIGPIKTEFNLVVEVTEERPPGFAATVTRGEEGSRVSVLSAHSTLRLAPAGDSATNVHYSSEVSVVGRLGRFGLGVMKKKAKAMGDEFAAAFRTRVEGDDAGSA